MFALFSCVADPDAGGASGLYRGDSGGEAGEDAAAHRVLPPFSAAQPGWGGSPPRPISGTLRPAHIWQLSYISVDRCIVYHQSNNLYHGQKRRLSLSLWCITQHRVGEYSV